MHAAQNLSCPPVLSTTMDDAPKIKLMSKADELYEDIFQGNSGVAKSNIKHVFSLPGINTSGGDGGMFCGVTPGNGLPQIHVLPMRHTMHVRLGKMNLCWVRCVAASLEVDG